MLQFEGWKKLLVILVTVFGVVYAAPNLMPGGDPDGGSFLPGQKINLGLDLQGGSHLLVRVGMDVIVNERLEGYADTIRQQFRTNKMRFRQLKIQDQVLSLSVRSDDDIVETKSLLRNLGPGLSVTNDERRFEIAYTDQGISSLQAATIEQSLEIIRRRIDPDGTKEPVIQRQGADRILIQLPGVDNPEEIKRLIGQTAKLTFQLVDSVLPVGTDLDRVKVKPSQVILADTSDNGVNYLVQKRVMVSGELLKTAQASFDQNNRPAVSFTLNSKGAKLFGRVTGENIGREFAIILDGKVVSAPRIQSQIFGQGQITGTFTVAETDELSRVLEAGALPAPLVVMEERSIGPGLGADSVAAGQIAALVGLALVIVYMILSYGLFGLLADVALMVNVVLILGALSFIQATLTLPGIAGIVLTMGMAVDANVLVFERIREELRRGRSVMAAIEGGYKRAISTIVDSNLTTLFAALFLYVFGSGPIKGFAVTLTIGIATSLFTAVMVTRMLIIIWLERKRPRELVL